MARSIGIGDKKMSSHERTPLIRTVRVARPPPRRPQSTFRRFCTIALGSSLIAVVVMLIFPIFIFPSRHYHPRPHRHHSSVTYDDLRKILLETPNNDSIAEWSKYYTAGPHLAGKNFSQVLWTQAKWQEFGIPDVQYVAYDTYINYPRDHRLALYERSSNGSAKAGIDSVAITKEDWKLKYEASLEEAVLDADPTSQLEDRIPTFHGYSASGNVTAPYVYVNYGTYQDFEDLLKANISLKGKIGIARYGGIFRGLKVKRAEDLGMVGMVIFTDPGDDGEITAENAYKEYPEGPARHPSSVQRGSVQFLSVAPGDPTTPGYPSKPGSVREPVKGRIPSIPSLPISYTDALPILKSLNGHGPNASDFNKYWNKNLGLAYKGVEYNVGPSPDSLVLNLFNDQEYVYQDLHDVIGIINGTLTDEVIIVGNHRDAWIAGGAGDPNSGSAALNELIRGFGIALQAGWKPLRTIVFASWDGEEYGLVGSTEWVEEYLPWLSGAAVAYINVDVGCSGPSFDASASPLLNSILYEVTSQVLSPNQTIPGQTVLDVWDKRIRTIGSGSDYTAFQDHAGIPSLDMGFSPKSGDGGAVYQYHSNYDSYAWMEKYGDPGFKYHVAITQMWGLVTAALSESPVVPMNATDYAIAFKGYIKQVEDKVAKLDAGELAEMDEFEEEEARMRPETKAMTQSSKDEFKGFREKFERLDVAAAELISTSMQFDAHADALAQKAGKDIPWWRWYSKAKLYFQIRSVNSKLKLLEREYLYAEGLESRTWFKHVVFAPGLWTGYAGAVLPGLVEAIEDGDWERAWKWVRIVEECMQGARKSLE